jgi:hypothetical protein
MGVPDWPKILYAPAVGKNPVGLCVPYWANTNFVFKADFLKRCQGSHTAERWKSEGHRNRYVDEKACTDVLWPYTAARTVEFRTAKWLRTYRLVSFNLTASSTHCLAASSSLRL